MWPLAASASAAEDTHSLAPLWIFAGRIFHVPNGRAIRGSAYRGRVHMAVGSSAVVYDRSGKDTQASLVKALVGGLSSDRSTTKTIDSTAR